VDYPDVADLIATAAEILDVDGGKLTYATDIGMAESAVHAPQAGYGDYELYPDVATKAAVLCSRIVRNHPLPDGNKRTGLLMMLTFLDMNGAEWREPKGSQDEIADVIERLAARDMSEADFIDWVTAHVS
jgi:death-on-curing protein